MVDQAWKSWRCISASQPEPKRAEGGLRALGRQGGRVLPHLFSATIAVLLFVAGSHAAHAATLFVTTSGSDTGNCQAAACLTPEYALTQAVSGDTIDIAAGDYQLSARLEPGSKSITFQGAGVRGANMTRLIAASSSNLIFFDTVGNASVIQDLVLQGNGAHVIYSGSTFPSIPATVQRNVILGNGSDGVSLGGSPTARGNIVLDPSRGMIFSTTALVDHNTVVNSSGTAFHGGVRTNNLAYSGSTGLADCPVATEPASYSNAFRNATDYSGAECSGGTGNISSAPRFLNVTGSPGSLSFVTYPNGTSTALGVSTLTDSTATWTTNQWAGYFVTPDLNRAKPEYFFILSNTATELTVVVTSSSREVRDFGSTGHAYGITDFTYGTNSPSARAGSGALSSDLYGTNWGQADIGAVAAQGTSSAIGATYHIATTGTDGTNTCTDPASPCKTFEHILTMAEDTDTVLVAAGTYKLDFPIDARQEVSLTFAGGYDTADNFASQNIGVRGSHITRLIAPAADQVFEFLSSGSTTAVRNFVLQGTTTVVHSVTAVNPTFEYNVLLANGFDAFNLGGGSNPTIRGNIFIDPSRSSVLTAGTIDHNTTVNASSNAHHGAVRTNNLIYAGSTGINDCTATETADYNLSFRNNTNYQSGLCSSGTGNLEVAPRFLNVTGSPGSLTYINNANGVSTSVGGAAVADSDGTLTTVLTDSNASWTTDQWAGYYVTPNTGKSRPQYFYILSNTATELTVVVASTGNELRDHGETGDPYGITDFTYGTNAPGAAAGNASLTTDLYGNNWGRADIGAVAAQGTSTAANHTFYVDDNGTDTFGAASSTCDSASAPCASINYVTSLAETGDTIAIAAGEYNLDYEIEPRDDANIIYEGGYDTADNFASNNIGVRGTYMTHLVAASGDYLFNFNTVNHASTIKNMVLEGNGTRVVYSNVAAGATVENNTILAKAQDGVYFNHDSSITTVRNNIVIDPSRGILLGNTGTASHNTVLNSSSQSLYGGDRTNNIAYGSASTGVYICNASETATNNLSFRNLINYQASQCDSEPTNLETSPRFLNVTGSPGSLSYINNANGLSTAVGTNTLTDSNASWTTDQWAGYFVTPDTGLSRPHYFFILSNTATELTVVVTNTSTEVRDFGSAGRPYGITDFTYGTSAPGADAGVSGGPTTDLYGTTRSNNDIGAVVAQGSSTAVNHTFYVATAADGGSNTFGAAASTCDDASNPCETINYVTSLAESGDSIYVAAGTHALSYPVSPRDDADITYVGGYSTSDNFGSANVGVHGPFMTHIRAPSGDYAFHFTTDVNSSTIRNFAIEANGSRAIYSNLDPSPIIESNTIFADQNDGVYFNTNDAAPIIRNNIVYTATRAILLGNNGTATHNTVVNATSQALYGGDRTNNIAYANDGTGIYICNASQTNTYNLSFRNEINFQATQCVGEATNLSESPRFLQITGSPGSLSYITNANGFSTGVGTNTLTDSGASWTTDQWKGYFVTPNIGDSRPQYFMILSNTATQLTVLISGTSYEVQDFGSIGHPYGITDFTYGTNAGPAAAGTSGGPGTDIYGTTRSNADMGAVTAQGTSIAANHTFYVDDAGTDTLGTTSTSCDSAAAPCRTIQYAVALAESGDTVRVAAGSYSLSYPIAPRDDADMTIDGGYDTSDNFATRHIGLRGTYMTRLTAPSGDYAVTYNSDNTDGTFSNFVIEANGARSVNSNADAGPTIDGNVIIARGQDGIYFNLNGATPTLQNNIVLEGSRAFLLGDSGTAINNTALNASSTAFFAGDRQNNISYAASGHGFSDCSPNDAEYSNAFASGGSNFGSGCDGGNNLQVDPLFAEKATSVSTGMTASTLTSTGAAWTTDEWKGYFVTPDTAPANGRPQYFFIESNTSDTLTVTSNNSLTSHGTSGDTFRITDFTLQASSQSVNSGTNTGAPSNDIYGVARPQATTVDMGATEYEAVPNITINDVGVTETESSVSANFTITLSATHSQGVTVNVATANNTATAGADYTAITTTPISFSSTETTKIVTVTVLGDTLDEDNETFFVNLSGAVNGTITDSQGVGTITDNDATPSVSFTSSSQASSNETGTMNVTAQLSATSGRTVTVPFTTGGSASGSDYSISSSPITINAGQSSANAVITITTDTLDEPNETVVVTMGSPTNATQGATTVHTATITDDDNAPTVQWSASSQSSANESGTMTVTAELSTASGQQVTVPFTVGGDASGSDYSITSSPLTINAGQTTSDATITITTDNLDEDNEQVVVTMGSATNATTSGTTVHTATITDDDPTPTVTLGLSGDPLDENGGVATVTATLSAVSGRDVTVGLAFSGDATLTSDYTRSGTSISINAGSSSNSITITGVDDDIDDDNEVVTVDINSCTNCTESGTQQVSATITDDDTAGVSIVETAASTDVTERGPTDTYTVVLTSEPLDDVDITVTPDSETTTNPTVLTFTSGDWDTPQTVTVTAVDDPVAEGNHSSTISHSASSTDPLYNGASIVDVTANIVDNDSAGVTVAQSGGTTAVTEGGPTDTYTVVLASEPTDDVVISVATSDLTHGVDRSPNQLTFTTVNWNLPQTVTVTASDDDRDEGNHGATLSHTAVSNDSTYDGIGIAPVNVTITDNDQSGVSISESGGSTSVSETGATDTYTAVLTSEPTDTVTVRVLTDKLVNANPTTLTFDESNWDTPQTVTIEASADASGLSNAALEAAKLQTAQSASTIQHQVTSNDSNYDGLQIDSVTVTVTLDESEAEEEDTETESVEFSARAGGDRTIVAGNDVRLDAFGIGTDWSFQWEILSDSPDVSLSSTSERNPVLMINAAAGPQDVEIRLRVTNSDGQIEEDTITIHVAKRANVIGKVLEQAVVGRIANELAYEQLRYDVDSDTFRTALRFGDTTLLLPDEDASYSFSETRDGRLALSVESSKLKEKAFVSRRAADQFSGTIDLADDRASFAAIGPEDAGDRWGAYLATGDVTGDGRDEVIVTDPEDDGVAFIYNDEAELVARVIGTEEYPLRSLKVDDYFDGASDDICFGPDNSAMNDSLQLRRSTVETLDRSFCLEGGNDFVGELDLKDRGVDVEIDVGRSLRAIETGDLDGDERQDVAVATDDGRVLVYFDAFDGTNELKEEDVDTTMRRGDTPDVDDCFGQSLTIGDVTGDSRNDLIIGEPCHDESRGRLTVAFGKEEWEPEIDLEEAPDVQTIEGLNPGDEIGADVFLDDNGDDSHDRIYTVYGPDEVFEVDLVEEVLSDSPLVTHSAGGTCSLDRSASSGLPFAKLLLALGLILAFYRFSRKLYSQYD